MSFHREIPHNPISVSGFDKIALFMWHIMFIYVIQKYLRNELKCERTEKHTCKKHANKTSFVHPWMLCKHKTLKITTLKSQSTEWGEKHEMSSRDAVIACSSFAIIQLPFLSDYIWKVLCYVFLKGQTGHAIKVTGHVIISYHWVTIVGCGWLGQERRKILCPWKLNHRPHPHILRAVINQGHLCNDGSLSASANTKVENQFCDN